MDWILLQDLDNPGKVTIDSKESLDLEKAQKIIAKIKELTFSD